jgi:hypothetical protein
LRPCPEIGETKRKLTIASRWKNAIEEAFAKKPMFLLPVNLTYRLPPIGTSEATARSIAASILLLALTNCSAPPGVNVLEVQQLGPIESPVTIDGRDGGGSGLFKGRSIWVYGDTVVKEKGSYPTTWRNNTMSWTNDLDASNGVSGFHQPVDPLRAPREFFPQTEDERAFNLAHVDDGDGLCDDPCGARLAIWGSAPLEDTARDRALLTYGKVYAEPGGFHFSILGTSIAVWEDFDEGPLRPNVRSNLDDPTLLFDAKKGEYAIPVIADERLYLFSCSGGPDDSRECRLARAPLENILHRDAWEFRSDDHWSTNIDDATPLFEGSPNLTVYWNAHLRRWVAIYMSWGEIIIRSAEQVQGPWSDKSVVFVPSEEGAIHAFGHAEYQENGGEVEYITYLAAQFRLLRVKLALP